MPKYPTMHEAFMAARKAVREALVRKGIRLAWVEPLRISEAAFELMRQCPRKYGYPINARLPHKHRT